MNASRGDVANILIPGPLLASSALEGAAIDSASPWSWGQVHAESLVLSRKLRRGATVCNLSGSRAGFLIGWLAALRQGCAQVLPSSGGAGDLGSILRSSDDPVVLVDDATLIDPQWAQNAECILHIPRNPGTDFDCNSLRWQPDWDAQKICLFTSGSTGAPEAHTRSLAQLVRGAQVLAERLQIELEEPLGAELGTIVSSVPPQHMFGLETSVMLPLVTGIPVQEGRPLLPDDVHSALARSEGAPIWVATPLHLRALARDSSKLPRCRLVVVSTMALAPAVALQGEALAGAPVVEIYGSTETGALAMRRTANEETWLPLADVQLEPSSDSTLVRGTHFNSPRRLADRIEIRAEGRFRLIGRHGDVIKIAGRRASLAGLNVLLQDLPGLNDGVFFLPGSDSPTERLVLIYAGPTLDRSAALDWLRARMDPVFLPRTLIHVERLPRTPAGKLPHAALVEIEAAHRERGRSAQ